MSTSTTIDSAMAATVARAVRSSLHGALVPPTMPFYAPPMAGHDPGLSAADVRRIVREELDRDRLERSVLADYGRLTAEWDRRHGVRR